MTNSQGGFSLSKHHKMKTFFLTILSLYLVANIYVSFATYHLMPANSALRTVALTIIIIGFVSPIIFFTFGERLPMDLAGFLYKFGTSWMIAFLYILLMFVLFDLFKLSNHIFQFADKELIGSIFKKNGTTVTIGFGAIALLLIFGNLHYHNKKRIHIGIQSEKIEDPLKIVGISDLHLGHTISRKELAKWVKMINRENPDLILIAGDLIDNQLRPLIQQSMDKELVKLKAPLGIYACTGNHEFISGIKESSAFYKKSGITLLRDSSASVGGLTIIGREDHSHKNRKSLSEIIAGSDLAKFSILLDHQPNNLDEAVENRIDFQLSGHTHHGQVFPISLITKKMFELSHGYKQKENSHFYVSSGLGIWGGKFRIGTQSEYLVLELKK